MNKLKYWYKISALKDIQDWNNMILLVLCLLFWIPALTNLLPIENTIINFLVTFCLYIWFYIFYNKYHKLGLRMYYFSICNDADIHPKTQNITFR